MYKSSTTTPAAWPSICQAGSSPLVMHCVTRTITCFVPSDARVCVDQTGGNGTTITVWADSSGASPYSDAMYRANTSIYEKTER